MKEKRTRCLFYNVGLAKIGGVETAAKNFIKRMSKYWDITFVYSNEHSDKDQLDKIKKYAKVVRNMNQKFETDICIYNSCWGGYPNVTVTNKKCQELQADFGYNVKVGNFIPTFPNDIDVYISCSENTRKSVKEAFGIDSVVIYNLLSDEVKAKPLVKFITPTRINPEKGLEQIYMWARQFKAENRNFLWYIYSDLEFDEYTKGIIKKFKDVPEVIFLPARLDLTDFIADCTYLVYPSKAEGFPYSPYEALQLGVPCILTNFKSASELVKDGKNGYIIDMNAKTIDSDKIFNNIPNEFKFKELGSEEQWLALEKMPNPPRQKQKNKPKEQVVVEDHNSLEFLLKEGKIKKVQVRTLKTYTDTKKGRDVERGEINWETIERAIQLVSTTWCEVVNVPTL